MRRWRYWVSGSAVGAVAALLTGFGLMSTLPLLTVALIVMVKEQRLVAVSGLMIGFGGSWLLLLANQLSSGGTLEHATSWVIVGIVPVAIGLVALVPATTRALARHRQAPR